MAKMQKEDVFSRSSDRKGTAGAAESLIRKFRMASFLILLSPIALIYLLCVGVALTPGVWLFEFASRSFQNDPPLVRACALALSLAGGFLCYLFSIILVVPLANLPFLTVFKLKPFRGGWYSLPVIPWYYHNALVQLVRYTALDLLTPTPFNILFFKLMGMKMGKNAVINTSHISDPCLIELGDNVTIGGSATLFAHYGMKGYIIIEKTVIRSGANIGLKASLMGDVVIGEGVTIAPHTVVLPKSRVESADPASPKLEKSDRQGVA